MLPAGTAATPSPSLSTDAEKVPLFGLEEADVTQHHYPGGALSPGSSSPRLSRSRSASPKGNGCTRSSRSRSLLFDVDATATLSSSPPKMAARYDVDSDDDSQGPCLSTMASKLSDADGKGSSSSMHSPENEMICNVVEAGDTSNGGTEGGIEGTKAEESLAAALVDRILADLSDLTKTMADSSGQAEASLGSDEPPSNPSSLLWPPSLGSPPQQSASSPQLSASGSPTNTTFHPPIPLLTKAHVQSLMSKTKTAPSTHRLLPDVRRGQLRLLVSGSDLGLIKLR